LPSYDLRQCELQLKELEGQIDAIRTASSAKSRFAFKRSTVSPAKVEGKASTDQVPPATSSAEVVPEVEGGPAASSQLSISKRRDAFLTINSIDVKPRTLPAQSSLLLMELESCVVDLQPSNKEAASPAINALHIRGLKRVVLICGYINGSVLVHDCEECLLLLGCRQFRIHTSKNTSVQLYVTSRPTIEHCQGITFAPYRSVDESDNLFPSEPSQHYAVQDFDWIKPTPPSPNWTKEVANDAATSQVRTLIANGAHLAIEDLINDVLPPHDNQALVASESQAH